MFALSKKIKSTLSLGNPEDGEDEIPVCDSDGDGFLDAEEAQLHPDAHPDGGLGCSDHALLERQRKAIVEVMKGLGKSLLTGNFDLLKISLPVGLFEPRSYLQKLADPWCYPQILEKASIATDPVERMRWVVTYIMAGFHKAFMKWAKPFNPILGETFQASLPDGTHIYVEQISHHPPISAFQMIGPKGTYQYIGSSRPAVSYKANAIKTSATGSRRFEFADGGVIDVVYPHYYIKGLLYTSAPRAELGGTAEFLDKDNGLRAVVHFGKVEGASSKLLLRQDAFSGTMYRINPTSSGNQSPSQRTVHRSKTATASMARFVKQLPALQKAPKALTEDDVAEPVATCTGNWLSHIDWDNTRYWTLTESEGADWIPDPNPLPSDCRYRKDLMVLQAGDIKEAQVAKEKLENIQRRDAKLRKGQI